MINKKDILNMNKNEITEMLIKKPQPKTTKQKNTTIKMKYSPFEDVPLGKRRCGNCGTILDKKEFKLDIGYDWKCRDCKEYLGVYN